jgi:hypothetical protein
MRSVSTRVSHVQIEIYEQSDDEVERMPGSTGDGSEGFCTVVMLGAAVSHASRASATVCVATPGSMGLMATLAGVSAAL